MTIHNFSRYIYYTSFIITLMIFSLTNYLHQSRFFVLCDFFFAARSTHRVETDQQLELLDIDTAH